jgi:hypothetical protein
MVRVDRAAITPDGVEVALPEIGELKIRLVDLGDRLFPWDGTAYVHFDHAAWLPEPTGALTIRRGESTPLLVEAGFHCTAQVHAMGFAPIETEGLGPVDEGDVATIDAVIQESGVIQIRGRVVGGDGDPWSGDTLVRLLAPTGRPGQWNTPAQTVQSAVDGSFEAPFLRSCFHHGECRLALRCSREDDRIGVAGLIDVALPESDDAIDLGDLVLEEAALLASGIVVDEAGQPIEDAEVASDLRPEWDSPWSLVSSVATTTPADGRFRFRGGPSSHQGRLYVSGTVDGWRATALTTFEPGDDLRIVLRPRGAIAGRVVVTPPMKQDDVYVAAAFSPMSQAATIWSAHAPLAADGSFVLEPLDPGPWRVGVLRNTSQATPAPLLVVEDVVVRGGEINRDPRLAALAIRGELRSVTLEVFAPTGEPATTGTLYVVDRGSEAGLVDARKLDGRPLRLVVDTNADAFIVAPGCRTEWVKELAQDRSVQLRSGAHRTLRFHVEVAPPPSTEQELVLAINPVELPLPRELWTRFVIDERGDVSFVVEDLGSYRLLAYRGAKGTRGAVGNEAEVRPMYCFVAEDDDVPRTLRIGE